MKMAEQPYALTIISSRLGTAIIGPLTCADAVVHKLVREANLTMLHQARTNCRGPRPTELPDDDAHILDRP